MREYFSLLKKMPLFHNATDEDIVHVLRCLEASEKVYAKNEIIFHCLEPIPYAGIVLEGEVLAAIQNADGREYGMRHFTAGDLFGEAYACVPDEPCNLQISACHDSRILFLRFSNLFSPHAAHCPHASKITANLLQETARNNIFQNKKITILTKKHIRDKLLSYLYTLPCDETYTVHIPFDRQGLANDLGVERSALSRELSLMRREGMLDFHKNQITLLRPPSGF